jgi:hypothetical protein
MNRPTAGSSSPSCGARAKSAATNNVLVALNKIAPDFNAFIRLPFPYSRFSTAWLKSPAFQKEDCYGDLRIWLMAPEHERSV